MHRTTFISLFALSIAVAIAAIGRDSCAAAAATTAAAGKVQFNRDIRPILSNNCFYCHGPDPKHREAKLRFDDRDVAVAKGAIVPGKPDDSEMVQRIFSDDEDEMMPPPAAHKHLTPAQKAMFKQWIAEGAVYEVFWAYQPIVRPPMPPVKAAATVAVPTNDSAAPSPIDAFILQGLQAERVAPSPEADRAILLRRVSLDLIGLPPTPDEVQAFVADHSPDAYEKVVDRLLASPHYGERMAVPWLDVVRYADTVGYHGDQNINVFPYRDYVINAFNSNKPFDRFTIEQLAGDLLPGATAEQQVATGFNRLNMVTREGGAQPGEYLAKYAADRVRTVAGTWLGATMGCCECHDHKFDPYTSKDFYQLGAFFADVRQWGVYNDYPYSRNPDLKGWSNDHPFPPEREADIPYLQKRQQRLAAEIKQVAADAVKRKRADAAGQAKFDAWSKSCRAALAESPDGWQVLTPVAEVAGKPAPAKKKKNAKPETRPAAFESSKEQPFAVQADGSVLLTGPTSGDALEFSLAAPTLALIRVELLPHDKHGGSILRGKGPTTQIKLLATLKSPDGKETNLSFHYAEADLREPRYSNGYEVLGILGGWTTSAENAHQRQTGVWTLDRAATVPTGSTLSLNLPLEAVGCVRVSIAPVVVLEPLKVDSLVAVRTALEAAARGETAGDPGLVDCAYLLTTGLDSTALADCRRLYREFLECRGGKWPAVVTVAWEPRPTRVLARGNWQDTTGELVQPGTPHFLPLPPNPAGRRLTRLDLAKWLVSPENPLTARVIANRLWKQFFGAGLSNTVDDLGSQGDPPSHPELLNWLAAEFRDSGWNVKHLVKLIVMSRAYRQDSNPRPELRERDPSNRWLASQSPRRLEAEFVRDQALFTAGLLNLDIGGPSDHPYQPAGYYANLQFPDRDYHADQDDRQYRRGLYMHWQRTFLHPMLANFDAPSREECTASRVVSNTPQQALTLLNDPSFVEAARVLAESLLATNGATDEQRLDRAFSKTLSHPPEARAKQSLLKFLAEQRAYYRDHADEASQLVHVGLAPVPADANLPELAAWTTVCRVMFNLHETITRY